MKIFTLEKGNIGFETCNYALIKKIIDDRLKNNKVFEAEVLTKVLNKLPEDALSEQVEKVMKEMIKENNKIIDSLKENYKRSKKENKTILAKGLKEQIKIYEKENSMLSSIVDETEGLIGLLFIAIMIAIIL